MGRHDCCVSDNSGKQRPPGRPFVAGQSGNPHGRPKEMAGIRKLIAERGPDMVRELMRIACGEGDAKAGDQIKAIEVCLSYWLGKPTQEVRLNVGDDTADLVQEVFIKAYVNYATKKLSVCIMKVSQ